CWRVALGLLNPNNYFQCIFLLLLKKNNSRVHVHSMQVCYICINVPCWCAAPIN
uniref:Uncharacterized protein n=1 Tax=Macaca fascicularis TaxID=9541 RepID=A0A7N9DHN3_MACFA